MQHTNDKKQRGSRRSKKLAGKNRPPPATKHNPPSRPPKFTGYNSPNPLPTVAKESAFEALNDISTTLKGEAFEKGLEELYASGTFVSAVDRERFNRVPPMIAGGSTLGIKGPVQVRSIQENCGMTAEEEKVVDDQFARHLEINFISGPYTIDEVEDAAGTPIRTSPIRVIPKAGPPGVKKWRIIDNLSAPKTPRGDLTSVNWNLDSAFETCTWTSNADLEARFLQYGADVSVMGIDLIEGFMHLPIAPSSRPHFCLYWRGGIYIRKVANFGCRTTPGVFGNAVDATLAIMKVKFPVSAFSQVDDIGIARRGTSVADKDIRNFLRSLGWRVHPEEADKGFTWSRKFKHNGVIWCLDTKTKTLSDDKRLKYLAFTTALHEAGTATLADMEKLLGYFIYVCSIASEMKSSLFHLFHFRRSFINPRGEREFNRLHREPIREWIKFLSQPTITRSFDLPPSTFHTAIYTDASNQGIGITAGKYIAGFAFRESWREDFNAHIGPAEAWGVEAGLDAALRLGAEKCYLDIFCDNLGVVWSWRKGWSRSKLQNESIARLTEITMRHNIVLRLTYVKSALNPADEPSRGIFPKHFVAFPDPPSHPYGTLRPKGAPGHLRAKIFAGTPLRPTPIFRPRMFDKIHFPSPPASQPKLASPFHVSSSPSYASVVARTPPRVAVPFSCSSPLDSRMASPTPTTTRPAATEAKTEEAYCFKCFSSPPHAAPPAATSSAVWRESSFTIDDEEFTASSARFPSTSFLSEEVEFVEASTTPGEGDIDPPNSPSNSSHAPQEDFPEASDDDESIPELVEDLGPHYKETITGSVPVSPQIQSLLDGAPEMEPDDFLRKYYELTFNDASWPAKWFPVVEKSEELAIEELANLLERAELVKKDAASNQQLPSTTTATRSTRNSEAARPSGNNTRPVAEDHYREPLDLSRETRSGDIVIPPASSPDWSWTDPTPRRDRYNPAWLKETERKDRLFLLGAPVVAPDATFFPLEVLQARMVVFAAAITLKTLEAYAGIVLRFVDWCWGKFDAEEIFPPKVPIVVAFIVTHGGKYRLGTLQKWMSALKWWFSLHGVSFNPPPHEWRSALRGIEALQPEGMAIRDPIRIEDLAYYFSTLDILGENPRPRDVCLKSCALTSFAAMARLGETTSETRNKAAKGKSPTIDNVKFVLGDEKSGTPAHAIIHLPFDKVEKAKGRDLTILQQTASPELNPLAALVAHIRTNDPPSDLHLFSYRTDADPSKWAQLTKSFMLSHFNEALAKADPPRGPYHGHAFRAGGATYFLKAKINPDVVKSIGNWRSDSFLRYWRETSLIAARTMSDLKLTSTSGSELHISELFDNEMEGIEGSEDIVPKNGLTVILRRPRAKDVDLEGTVATEVPAPKRTRRTKTAT
ncbi:hypothetical protein P7C70_g3284, partial [Phenoliferia sp. Uapishka_3]